MGNKFVVAEGETHSILGFYDDAVSEVIPSSATPITLEEWKFALNINADKYENGVFYREVVIKTPEEVDSYHTFKRNKEYVREAYPLFFKWQISESEEDREEWRLKVLSINNRYPVSGG